MTFFPQGGVSGVPSSVNLGPLISWLFVRWLLCVKLFLCFSFLHSLATFVVKVKRRSKLCEGQPLCHSALRCCLVRPNLLHTAAAGLSAQIRIVLDATFCGLNLSSNSCSWRRPHAMLALFSFILVLWPHKVPVKLPNINRLIIKFNINLTDVTAYVSSVNY